jgi:hypothetical protein
MMFKKIALFCTLIVGFHAGSALALTPGNVTLNNKATLTYGGGVGVIEATATVKVNVIASTPTLSVVGAITKAENQPISGTEAQYTVTATNNGPDTYTFQPDTLASGTGLGGGTTNADFSSVEYKYYTPGTSTSISSVALGASAIKAATTTTAFTVPNDGGTDNDNIVNGLNVNDTVIINSNPYTISAIDDSVTGGDVTITLSTAHGIATTGDAGIGTGVFERKSFDVRTSNPTGGVGAQPATPATTNYIVTTTLRPTLTVPTSADATATFQVNIVNVTILKYVRNATASRGNFTEASAGDCTNNDVTVNSVDYYLTTGAGSGCSVEARPGEVLEYLIQVTTPAGGALTSAVIKDEIDAYTTYKTGTTKMGSNNQAAPSTVVDEASDGFPLAPGADDGGLVIQSAALGGSTAEPVFATATVDASSTVNVIYQVDVR